MPGRVSVLHLTSLFLLFPSSFSTTSGWVLITSCMRYNNNLEAFKLVSVLLIRKKKEKKKELPLSLWLQWVKHWAQHFTYFVLFTPHSIPVRQVHSIIIFTYSWGNWGSGETECLPWEHPADQGQSWTSDSALWGPCLLPCARSIKVLSFPLRLVPFNSSLHTNAWECS